MQQEQINATGQNDKIVYQFIQGFLDTRKRESKNLKRMNRACQRMVETRISQTPDLKHLLSLYESDPWVRNLLVNHVLLKMHHQAALWSIENLQPKPALEVHYKKRFYLNRRSRYLPES